MFREKTIERTKRIHRSCSSNGLILFLLRTFFTIDPSSLVYRAYSGHDLTYIAKVTPLVAKTEEFKVDPCRPMVALIL